MIEVLKCTNCEKSERLPVILTVMYEVNECDKCHYHRESAWKYYFCNLTCQMDWLVSLNIRVGGVPCRMCVDTKDVPTGFAFGYESNGVCKTCNGNKRVKIGCGTTQENR